MTLLRDAPAGPRAGRRVLPIRLLARAAAVDRLVRVHQVGFVLIWPLLGWACVAEWTPVALAALLAIALCFNTFGVLHNDVVDLGIDRGDPLKADYWLVSGVLTPSQVLRVAYAQLPLMALAHLAAGFPPGALPWLAGAVFGQWTYNRFGKTFRVPPLMEAFEAAGAFLLVVYGAAAAGATPTRLVWLTASAGAAFIMLVNAFHGCLRDIDVELAYGARTTPIWLGCRGVQAGVVHISAAMSAWSTFWQSALVAVSVWAAWTIEPSHDAWRFATLAASLLNGVLFVALHRVRKPLWDLVMRAHVSVLAVPIMLAFVPRIGPAPASLLFALYVAPTLLTVHWWWTATHKEPSEAGMPTGRP